MWANITSPHRQLISEENPLKQVVQLLLGQGERGHGGPALDRPGVAYPEPQVVRCVVKPPRDEGPIGESSSRGHVEAPRVWQPAQYCWKTRSPGD